MTKAKQNNTIGVAFEMKVKEKIIDEEGMRRTITRLAHEIIEHNRGVEKLVIVGMRTRGVPIAKRIAAKIEEIEGKRIPFGTLDITFYRDDFRKRLKQPAVLGTHIPFPIDEMTVVLVDDVFYTGRTARAALEALMDFGRAARVELVVLIDRGHRELPIRPDYVGRKVLTSIGEEVRVQLKEQDGEDCVLLVESPKD